MESLLTDLGDLIERHRAWAGPLLALVTFGESMVLIGAFFPATALMLIAGGLAATGVLHPLHVLVWCIAGAVAGDAVSYWLGRRVGPAAWRHPVLRPHRGALASARGFFRRHGVLSIFLCRFMGPVRAFVPLIAGVTGMGEARFQLANVASALIWVPTMLAPGYLAAKGAGLGADLHEVGLGGAAILVALILRRRAAALLTRGWRWLTYADGHRGLLAGAR